MNPNAALAPSPRLMHDIMPPYAAALARTQSPAPELAQQNESQSIPVKQEADTEPVMFPVDRPAEAKQEESQPTQQTPQPAVIEKNVQPIVHQASAPKINWLIIGAAVLVSSGLLFAAYIAFSQNS